MEEFDTIGIGRPNFGRQRHKLDLVVQGKTKGGHACRSSEGETCCQWNEPNLRLRLLVGSQTDHHQNRFVNRSHQRLEDDPNRHQ